MNDERAFLTAILEQPDDDARKLVYADLPEERGDPRGEYLRLMMRVRQERVVTPEQRQRHKELSEELARLRVQEHRAIRNRKLNSQNFPTYSPADPSPAPRNLPPHLIPNGSLSSAIQQSKDAKEVLAGMALGGRFDWARSDCGQRPKFASTWPKRKSGSPDDSDLNTAIEAWAWWTATLMFFREMAFLGYPPRGKMGLDSQIYNALEKIAHLDEVASPFGKAAHLL
jgi:uncharacterized protein (TIGR02996 family)